MDAVKFIKETPSDELYKHHLKVVFETYYKLFGEVCTGCPTKISGYIKRIKNFKKTETMSQTKKSNFVLRGMSLIIVPGTSKAYSNASLTDEIAIAFIKKNPNRKALFSKVPDNLDELLSDNQDDSQKGSDSGNEKALKDHTVAELKALYPEAKGRTKSALLEDIQSIINEAAVKAEAEEKEKQDDSQKGSEEEE